MSVTQFFRKNVASLCLAAGGLTLMAAGDKLENSSVIQGVVSMFDSSENDALMQDQQQTPSKLPSGPVGLAMMAFAGLAMYGTHEMQKKKNAQPQSKFEGAALEAGKASGNSQFRVTEDGGVGFGRSRETVPKPATYTKIFGVGAPT